MTCLTLTLTPQKRERERERECVCVCVCAKLCSKERVLLSALLLVHVQSVQFELTSEVYASHDNVCASIQCWTNILVVKSGAGGHSIRCQTVPNKDRKIDGRQGLIIPVYLLPHREQPSAFIQWHSFFAKSDKEKDMEIKGLQPPLIGLHGPLKCEYCCIVD